MNEHIKIVETCLIMTFLIVVVIALLLVSVRANDMRLPFYLCDPRATKSDRLSKRDFGKSVRHLY